MNLNEKQLKEVIAAEVFPIYIYWDSAEKKFIYLTEKQENFFGIIYRNPFEKKLIPANYSISEEDVARIDKIIAEIGCVEEINVIPNAHLFTDLGFDSLDADELIINIEKAFHISTSKDETRNIHRVSDIYSVAAKRLADKK